MRVIRAEVSGHDVITMVFTLSCPAFPAGIGHFEIPCPRHVEPSPHERLVGTSPQCDLLLCVLVKSGWSSTGLFPLAEGKPHLATVGAASTECGKTEI